MALSDVEKVYQEAVDLIGEISITENSDQDNKPYSTCVIHYPQARDEMISGYAWNEATEQALCLQDSERPVHTWTYRFALPNDCLRALHTTRPREDWRVMGRFAYTNYKLVPSSYSIGKKYYAEQYLAVDSVTYLIDTTFTATVWTTDISYCTTQLYDYGFLEIEYIKDLIDPTSWSATLRQAIVLNLACKIIVPITADRKARQDMLEELYKLVLPHASAIDAMTGKPKQFFFSEWTDARI